MNKGNTNNCNCGCSRKELVLTITQLDSQTVLEPENLENRDKTLVLSRNINGAYTVKVMSTMTVKDVVTAIQDPNVAFLLAEMKEPAAPTEPEEPGTTVPEEPDTEEPNEGEEGREPDNADEV